jgi:endonuclease G, mitochondrial
MSALLDQITKARDRSSDFDVAALVEGARDKVPGELTSAAQLAKRRRFLSESLGDEVEATRVFERIILGNELQDANYLARGARAARAVARIAICKPSGQQIGWGTGFLIAPGVLITNNHVLPSPALASRSIAQFRVELDIDGNVQAVVPFSLAPDRLFYTSMDRDFTVVAVEPRSNDSAADLTEFGFLPLVGTLGKVAEGEWLTIIQHPNGERKQVCVRENKLLKIAGDVLWYSTDTLGGSSGSPVHNNDWYVVALHHSGVPQLGANGRIQTNDGRDFDANRDGEDSIKWVANEGIRVSRILAELHAKLPAHPLLRDVFSATPEESRLRVPQAIMLLQSPLLRSIPFQPMTQPLEPTMSSTPLLVNERMVTVTLGISPDGGVRVISGGAAERAAFAIEAAKAPKEKAPTFDVPFNADYSDRKGFSPDFLGKDGLRVHLPKLGDAAEAVAAPLLKQVGANANVLHYHHYSVVMHEERRLAMYSAANVDFGGRWELSRPTDVWRTDSRISTDAQLTNFYYRSNKFDRGHLTRREDLEFGKTWMAALVSAADTCHWTNCTPQHEKFNQNKELWQGIERYILEQSVEDDAFRAQVITGPILAEDDPTWDTFPKIQYPVRFWKVVAAIDANGKLFATAYILDQSGVIDQFGIEVAREIPFGAYKTFQTTIAEVERETGLTFWSGPDANPISLSQADPLPKAPKRPRRPRAGAEESLGIDVPDSYRYLDSLEAILLP